MRASFKRRDLATLTIRGRLMAASFNLQSHGPRLRGLDLA